MYYSVSNTASQLHKSVWPSGWCSSITVKYNAAQLAQSLGQAQPHLASVHKKQTNTQFTVSTDDPETCVCMSTCGRNVMLT
jgi:hypothetical protein